MFQVRPFFMHILTIQYLCIHLYEWKHKYPYRHYNYPSLTSASKFPSYIHSPSYHVFVQVTSSWRGFQRKGFCGSIWSWCSSCWSHMNGVFGLLITCADYQCSTFGENAKTIKKAHNKSARRDIPVNWCWVGVCICVMRVVHSKGLTL